MKYWHLFSHLFRNNLAREMEYRASFFFWMISQTLWVIVQIALISVFFTTSENIHGWDKNQLYLLIGMFRCVDGVFHILFYRNLLNFPENIRTGDFDLYLTKPAGTLFLMSSRYQQLYEIGTFLTGVVVILYSLTNMHYPFSVGLFSTMLLSIFSGIVSIYSIMLFFSSLSFFFTRLTALESMWDMLSKTLRIPLDLITQGNNIANAFLLPLLIVVTIPAQIITQKISFYFLILEAPLAMVIFYLSLKFFNFALRRYSSASS